VPPDCVRCTRELNSELLTFRNSRSRFAIIHRIVQCSTGLSDVPAEQRLLRANGRLQRAVNALQCAQKSELSQKAHRTVRWARRQKLQRSNPNGRVTWLAHRTVSGGAPDCPVRHATAASTNGSFGGWGYKYPQPPTIHCIQVFSLQTSYKSYSIQYKTQTREIKSSPKSGITPTKLVTRERDICVHLISCAWIAFLLPSFLCSTHL
jgi:hypothetical protein